MNNSKKVGILIILIAAIILILALILPKNCTQLEKEINSLIEEMNYCQEDEDCDYTYRRCPFGCYQFYNKNEDLSDLNKKIESFHDKRCMLCEYGCMELSPENVGCVNKKCVDKRFV